MTATATAEYATLTLKPRTKYYANHTGQRVKISSKELGTITVDLGQNKRAVKFGPTEYTDLSIDPLLPREKEALQSVRSGRDIWNFGLASDLRQVEKKCPHLLTICPAMNAPKDGTQRQPYFGCIATDAGREYLNTRPLVAADE